MLRRPEIEDDIAKYFKKVREAYGYVGFKIVGIGHAGIPDQILGAEGKLYLVELKRPKGGVFSGLQKLVRKKLASVGVTVHNINTKEKVDTFFFKIKYIWN